jgi:hypothetical protein
VLTSIGFITAYKDAGDSKLLLTKEQDERAVSILRRNYSVQPAAKE